MTEPVTISKAHFAALLRRAKLHTMESYDASSQTNAPPGFVLIRREEHDALRKTAHEFEALRQALYRGGLAPETFEELITSQLHLNGENDVQESQGDGWRELIPQSSGVPIAVHCTDPRLTPDSEQYEATSGLHPRPQTCFNRSISCGTESYDLIQDNDFDESNETPSYKPPFPRHDKRSLHFANLSDGTAYKDIVDVVRGGRVLDIYLRKNRSATVSFVEGTAAEAFFIYAKKRDIYIRQKRIEVRWADRHSQLPSHMANKISNGATRNLVIHGGASKLSELQIREDMEHIHNLVILDVKIEKGDIYLSTNSINNASFARTCMISRRDYKGLNIEWYRDECDGPLPKPQLQAFTIPVQARKTAARRGMNPYAPLFVVEDNDNDAEDDENMGHSSGEAHEGLGIAMNWSRHTIKST